MPAAVVEEATPIRANVSNDLRTLLEEARENPSSYANDAPLIPPSIKNQTAEKDLNKAAQSEGLPLPYPNVDAEDDEIMKALKATLHQRGDQTK